MNRNMTSLARDRRTARPVFRSFLDGMVLLAFTALLLTVQVTPVDHLAGTTGGSDGQPIRASLLPSIISDERPAPEPGELPGAATTCSATGIPAEVETFKEDAELLVIVVRPQV